MGERGETLMIIVLIGISVVIMVILPLTVMADKTDDAIRSAVQADTTEYANEIAITAVMTRDDFDTFIQTLASYQNLYSVEITLMILDENPAKKTSSGYLEIDGNTYYIMKQTQIDERFATSDSISLKAGDIVIITVEQESSGLIDSLLNWLFKDSSDSTVADATAQVTTTAN